MQVTVRELPKSEPLRVAASPSWVEFRDARNSLILLIVFMPDNRSFLVSSIKDSDFYEMARNTHVLVDQPVSIGDEHCGRQSVSVHYSPLEPSKPLINANMVEIRDEDGFLTLFILFAPGRAPNVVDKLDPRFEQFANEFRLPLKA